MTRSPFARRGLVAGVAAVGAFTLLSVLIVPALASNRAASSTTFSLFPNAPLLNCLKRAGGPTPTAVATVTRGGQNDTMNLKLTNFKPNLGFDLFTVQRSPQRANGTPDPNFKGSFGLAWYQSDITTNSSGAASVQIKTILLDQIFGFDPDKNLAPTNTFHVGFWFDSPAETKPCGVTTVTPFNGEHHAGVVAFITRPRANGLGPLCVNPTSTTPAHCIP
jgi:hypothetical protein